MSTFQPSIPTGTVKFSEDYTNIQQNFNQLDVTFGVDHVTFSNQTAQNGYHKDLHMVPVSTVASNPPNNNPIVAPATVAGIGQLFTAQNNDGFNSDESLFFLTGGGRQMRLTSNVDPLKNINGYTFLPGGFLMQWAKFTAVGSVITAKTFISLGLIDFPNNCYNMQATINNANSENLLTISAVTKTGFNYFNTSSTAKDFFIVAIGN